MPEVTRRKPEAASRHARRLLLSATALSMMAGGVAHAQLSPNAPVATAAGSAAAPPPPSDGSTLNEVVVTAEKRVSTVQKTPISITAITGADLKEMGLTSAQDIVAAVPGISVQSAGPGQAAYEIRGLSSDGGESPTIGFYIDDIPITPPAQQSIGKTAVDPNLYDLERVEVLRGPQGTLYGAGSMGGTIRLVTTPPDPKGYSASSQTSASGANGAGLNYSQDLMVNLPLVGDRIALRLSGSYEHDSGWIDRVVVPNFPALNADGSRGQVVDVPGEQTYKGVNDTSMLNFHAGLLLKPTDRLTITPSVMYENTRSGGMSTYDSDPGVKYLAHFEAYNVPEPFQDVFTLVSLPVTYNFDHFNITSATGYWARRSFQQQDDTEALVLNVPFPAYDEADGGPGPSSAFERDITHQLSEELRITSTGTGPLHWIGGIFYAQFWSKFDLGSDPPGMSTPAELAIFGSPVLYHVYETLDLHQEALFGNVSYDVTNKLKVQVGLRYFLYQNTVGSSSQGYLYQISPPLTSTAKSSASGVNPMFNVSYQVDPNLMVYATAAKGFREGAGNFPIPLTGPGGSICLASLQAIGLSSAPSTFGPDSVWSFEVGEKGRFADGRVTFNSDVYDIQWNGVQEPVALACGNGFTTNGPNAEVRGLEGELQAVLVKGLTVQQSVGYAYAAFTQSFLPAAVVAGEPLLDAPHWTLSSLLRYRRPINQQGLYWTAQLRNSYTSSSYDLSYAVFRLPARNTLSLRTGLETSTWSAHLYVDNALNQRQTLENLNSLSYTGPPYNRVSTNQPLTAGLTFEYNFN